MKESKHTINALRRPIEDVPEPQITWEIDSEEPLPAWDPQFPLESRNLLHQTLSSPTPDPHHMFGAHLKISISNWASGYKSPQIPFRNPSPYIFTHSRTG